MGKATIVNYVDDITGKPIDRTEAQEVQIIVGGFLYTLDLGEASLAKHVRPLIEKAPTKRRFSGASSNVVPMVAKRAANGGAPVFSRAVADKEKRQAARAWWLRNFARHELLPSYSAVGRIPQVVTNLYNENSGRDFPLTLKREESKPVKAAPKPVATPAFSEAEPESKPLSPAARRSAVAASKSGRKATTAKATSPTASRARSRTAKA